MPANERYLVSLDGLNELVDEFRKRRDDLLATNNAELERRRSAEAEIEQLRVDVRLARSECARLRKVLSEVQLIADHPSTDLVIATELRICAGQKFPPEAA